MCPMGQFVDFAVSLLVRADEGSVLFYPTLGMSLSQAPKNTTSKHFISLGDEL